MAASEEGLADAPTGPGLQPIHRCQSAHLSHDDCEAFQSRARHFRESCTAWGQKIFEHFQLGDAFPKGREAVDTPVPAESAVLGVSHLTGITTAATLCSRSYLTCMRCILVKSGNSRLLLLPPPSERNPMIC